MHSIRRVAIAALISVFLPEIIDAQWIATNGPYGAYVKSLVTVPRDTNGSDLLLGTIYGGGVFLSTNGGVRWARIGAGLPDTTVNAVARIGTTVFAGTKSGVFRSSDNGASWNQINNGLTNSDVSVLFVNDGKLFAGTGEGVVVFNDSSGSWMDASAGLPAINMRSFAQMDSTLFAATARDVFRSTNGGTVWDSAGTPPTGAGYFAVFDTLLFAGGSGVSVSSNHGDSWTEANHGLTTQYIWSLAAVPDGKGGASLFAATWGDGVFRSTDLGANWTAVNAGLADLDVRALAVIPNENGTPRIYAGTWGSGVFSSTDNGASWNGSSDGLNPLGVLDFAVNGPDVFVVTNKFGTSVYRSSDNGERWVQLGNLDTDLRFYSIAVLESSLVAGAYADLFYSRDGGATWTPSSTSFRDITVLSFAATDSFYFAGTDGGVYRSADSGETWTPLHGGGSTIISIQHGSSSNGRRSAYLFTITNDGVFRSTDNGSSWTAINNGLTYTNIASLAACDTILFAASQPSAPLSRSTDYGETWTQLNTGIPDATYRGFAVSGHNVFAGTLDYGIILSSDLGSTWSPANTGLTSNSAQPLGANETYLFATSGGKVWLEGIVWRRPLAEMIVPVHVPPAQFPARFSLEQNWPNPFNPVTMIKYTVGGAGEAGAGSGPSDPVLRTEILDPEGRNRDSRSGGPEIQGPGARKTRLVIYDLLGRQVATLVDEVKAPGSYEVSFDGSRLSSGVYYYRLNAGSFTQTRAMMMVK